MGKIAWSRELLYKKGLDNLEPVRVDRECLLQVLVLAL